MTLRPWAAVLLLVLTAAPASAQTGENVAVIINDASPASQKIGDYYVLKRAVPETNVIHLKTTADDTIPRGEFAANIEQPIAVALRQRGLQDRVLYIVLTKGVPLRIAGSTGPSGTIASVDSELTLLYRRMMGRSVLAAGHVDNPYFLGAGALQSARPFTHREHDIYLVSRLDAFTVEEAMALVDRGVAPSTDGRFVLDERGDERSRAGDAWIAEAARRLTELGQGERVTLESTTWPALRVADAIGYYSWGSNDTWNQRRRSRMGFVPGALAATLVSTDGRTFQEPPDGWEPSDNWNSRIKAFAGSPQSLVADLIRDGVTGAAANVAEPLVESIVRPDILFPAYVSGFNLAESFYLGLPHLSWQSIVIGDPLCRPFTRTPLTSARIEDPVDEATGLPGILSRRMLEAAHAASPDVPEKALALVLLADSRNFAKDTAGARAALVEATTIAPTLASAQLQLGLILEQAGEYEAAMERYRRVIESSPKNAVALNNLAYALAVRHNAPDEALPLARRAVSAAPQDPTVIDTLGWIEHLLGHTQEAARLLTEAVRRDRGTAEIRLHAAIVYFAAGAVAAAEEQLKVALRVDPAFAKRDDVVQLQRQIQAARK